MSLYVRNTPTFIAGGGGGGGVSAVGTIDSVTPSADGAVIQAPYIFMQSASATVPGLVNLTTQAFAGHKQFANGLGVGIPAGTGFDVEVANQAGGGAIVVATGYTNTVGGNFIGRNAGGTYASPTPSQANDVLGSFSARGYGDTAFSSSRRGAFRVFAGQNWTDTAQGTYATVEVTPNTTTTPTTALLINNDTSIVCASTISVQATGATGVVNITSASGAAHPTWSIKAPNTSSLIFDNASSLSLPLVMDYTGKVGIGTTPNGNAQLDVRSTANQYVLQLFNPVSIPLDFFRCYDGSNNLLINFTNTGEGIFAGGVTATGASTITQYASPASVLLRRADGSATSPTAVQSGESVGILSTRGYGASGFINGNGIALEGVATQNYTNSAGGTKMNLYTTPNGSISPVLALTLGQDSTALFSGATTVPDLTVQVAANNATVGAQLLSTGNFAANVDLNTNRSTNGNTIGAFRGLWNGTTIGSIVFLAATTAGTTRDDGKIAFFTRPTGGSNTQRMTIDENGLVGVAMTPARQLDVTGTFGATGASQFGSTLGVTGVFTPTAGIQGVTTNSSAATGLIGEYVESLIVTPTNIPGATGAYGDGTSISLTAGDWDVSAVVASYLNGSTMTTSFWFGISTTSGNSATGLTEGINYINQNIPSVTTSRGGSLAPYRILLSGTTTVYLKLFANYSLGNPQFTARLSARRMR